MTVKFKISIMFFLMMLIVSCAQDTGINKKASSSSWTTAQACISSGGISSPELFSSARKKNKDFVSENKEILRKSLNETIQRLGKKQGLNEDLVIGSFTLVERNHYQQVTKSNIIDFESCMTCVKRRCGPNGPHIQCCGIGNCCKDISGF